MNETIYKHAAIETVRDVCKRSPTIAIRAMDALRKLPSAQRWIPVTEKLPEDSQFVLITIRRMDEHYNHEPFISVGYISWNQSAWWCIHDGDCKSHDVRVDAWMPLPEPWKEGDE